MKRPVPVESASALIDEKIKELGDWRGKTLAKVREIIHEADPEILEEWKWMGTPIWSHGGIVCTGETYKNVVKMTFPNSASSISCSTASFSSYTCKVSSDLPTRLRDSILAPIASPRLRFA